MDRITDPTPPDAFMSEHFSCGSQDLFQFDAPSFAVHCTPRGFGDYVKVAVPIAGVLEVQQRGLVARLAPGCFTFIDLGQPFELRTSGAKLLNWRLPKEQLERRHPDLDLRSGRVLGQSSAGERLIAQLFAQLSIEAPKLVKQEQPAALRALFEAMGMAPRRVAADQRGERVRRALQAIEQSLSSVTLQPSDIARQQGVSRRYLDGLMREHTQLSLADTIRTRRLERAAQDLRESKGPSTADIARRWGFVNPSHFSRVFRRHFGVSPQNYVA